MRQNPFSHTRPLFFVALLGLASLCALAQEGYDPLRPIQTRIAKQNVVILLDNSFSMAEVPSFTYYSGGTAVAVSGLQAGEDRTGGAPVAGSLSTTKLGTPCTNGTQAKKWVYTYTITQALPSKMALVKNALGTSLTVHTPWIPPATWSYAGNNNPWNGLAPVITHAWNMSTATLTWTLVWTKDNGTQCKAAPGAPFDINLLTTLGQASQAMTPGYLLTRYSQTTNFALLPFSGVSSSASDVSPAADLTDGAGNLSALNAKMGYTTAGGLGLGTTNGTPTQCAIDAAVAALNGYYNTPDPKRDCPGRSYSILLITDGAADYCGGGAWTDSCPQGNYANYLPGSTEAAWNATTGRRYRTWVVGLGNAVRRCELNWAAFMGRTDASRPGDFGFVSTSSTDPYLAGTRAAGGFSPTTNYAFFADMPQQIPQQLNTLLSGMEKNLLQSLKGETVTSSSITYNYMGLRMIIPTVEMVSSDANYLWRGHLRAFDIGTSPAVETWDAGAVLSSSSVGTDHTDGRAIYTWNTAVTPPELVEVKASNASVLNTLCGNCGVTADVVNFIRGYEPGSTTAQRSWLLGPIVNSTPAMVGGPEKWSRLDNHANYQKRYASRHPILYVGSSDGMLHAFDPADGKELFALLPPDQLAKNVPNTTNPILSHYSTYALNNPTGQGRWPNQHIYGVANSPRFGDAYDVTVVHDSTLPEYYRTILFLTQGPGGKTLAAFDVSHPYPGRTGVTVYGQTGPKDFDADPDFDCDSGAGTSCNSQSNTVPTRVQLLWAKDGTTTPAMGFTWSMPAMALNTDTSSVVSVGSGVTGTTDTSHNFYALNALDGSLLGTQPTGLRTGSLVTSQAFADSTIWRNATDAIGFKPDNLANEIVQADLGGRIWAKGLSTSGSIILDPGATHPIYYSPAVATYGQGTATKILYGYGSGTYFEKSLAVTGPTTSFRGTLFLAAKDVATGTVQNFSLALTDIPVVGGTSGATLSDYAQLTSAPTLFVPKTLGKLGFVLCTVFDPDAGSCGGTSYLVMLSFDPNDLSSTASAPTGTSVGVGSGFATGFSLANGQVIVAVSSPTGAPTPVVAQGVSVNVSGGPVGASDRPNYYVELQ